MTNETPTNETVPAEQAEAYAEQFTASAEQVLDQMKQDTQALLDSLPADAATSLINDPERELLDVEVAIATGLERMLDEERGNKYLNEDYVAFFRAAVAVDPEALAIKDKIQAILESLEEDAAVALVRDPFRALTAQEFAIIDALDEEDLTQQTNHAAVLNPELSRFLADNVRVADDDEE
jgi:exonuclease VII large subunit